ncbi:Clip-Associating Protein 2 [Manis pentadactyla]|nr:Clip-Associating Protein 2 [Manis pentadactyla]
MPQSMTLRLRIARVIRLRSLWEVDGRTRASFSFFTPTAEEPSGKKAASMFCQGLWRQSQDWTPRSKCLGEIRVQQGLRIFKPFPDEISILLPFSLLQANTSSHHTELPLLACSAGVRRLQAGKKQHQEIC